MFWVKVVRITILLAIPVWLLVGQLLWGAGLNLESRRLAPLPQLLASISAQTPIDPQIIRDLPSQSEAYLVDNLPQRSRILSLFNFARMRLNQQSTLSPQVAKGKNGFYFSTTSDQLGAYSGELYTSQELEALVGEFEARRQLCTRLGKQYAVLFTSTKNQVYPHYTPSSFGFHSPYNKSLQLQNALEKRGFLLYSVQDNIPL